MKRADIVIPKTHLFAYYFLLLFVFGFCFGNLDMFRQIANGWEYLRSHSQFYYQHSYDPYYYIHVLFNGLTVSNPSDLHVHVRV